MTSCDISIPEQFTLHPYAKKSKVIHHVNLIIEHNVSVLYIPRKILLSPYAKKCIVFYHIFRTKCWYWANTSTLSLSACKQSAGIGSIPALCGLIFHIFVISQFFLQFFVLFDNSKK